LRSSAASVVYKRQGRVEQSDPEILTRLEVDLLPEQVEDDQERPLRDLPLLLDDCAHLPKVTRV
jgi:hypothetical protein